MHRPRTSFNFFIIQLTLAVILPFWGSSKQSPITCIRSPFSYGAWIWIDLLGFLSSSISAIINLILRHVIFHTWPCPLFRATTPYIITDFPPVLCTIHQNWNGSSLYKHRGRIGLNFTIFAMQVQSSNILSKNPMRSYFMNIACTIILFRSL